MTSKLESNSRKDKPAIDWHKVRQRLGAVTDTLNRGMTPEEVQAVLKDRARKLALEPHREDAATESLEILEFSVSNETYAIETSYVTETRPLRDITPLPCTPSFVLGLIGVRGQVVSVIDIKKFFDLPEKGLANLNKVIIIHDKGMEFGILADSVLGVRTVPMEDLQPSLPTLTGLREEYLKGVTRERTVVLDGKKLLGDKKIVVHEEIED